MHTFLNRRDGATAVEFAIIAPVFLSMMFGAIVMGIAIWSTSVLNQVAAESARCLAVGGADCTDLPSGCISAAAICFVTTLADRRGLPGLSVSDISIEPDASIGVAVSTRVTLTRPFTLLGYTMTLSGSASYPNS
ncbi:TadE/TadG family type IV pilus assembly protein [Rhizobium sp. 9140]|uniref:TadE/TadG family type IV pilus assembly protein n=1 Tax=Rhizobium sp. 9140 TaxID=1761900 RepID=UPI00079C9308|nr:TadE/TadG family type IV pilus assembly protein [Rhizobium sp. 9140]CZT35758.1 TadE-like protein [Rhizobium sp. 9140]